MFWSKKFCTITYNKDVSTNVQYKINKAKGIWSGTLILDNKQSEEFLMSKTMTAFLETDTFFGNIAMVWWKETKNSGFILKNLEVYFVGTSILGRK